MTDDQKRKAISDFIEKRTKEVTVSKKSAREFLIREGFYTQEGQLTEQYGGAVKKRV